MPEAPEVPEATTSVSHGLGAGRHTLQVTAQEVALEVESRAPSAFTEPQNHLGWERPSGSPRPTADLPCQVPSPSHVP